MEDKESPMRTWTLAEIIPCDIMPETYSLLKDFEKKNIQNQLSHPRLVLQTSIDRLLTEDENAGVRAVSKDQPLQATKPY